MHPNISKFPGQEFYGGTLKDFRDAEAYDKEFPAEWKLDFPSL